MTENKDHRDSNADEIDVLKIGILLLENWYFFAASIILCLTISYAYTWYVHPVYEMTTTVLVEDDGNDISQGILDEVGVIGKKRNIENEIAILNSRSLVEKAMTQLDINVSHLVHLGPRQRVLYQNTPIKLEYALTNPTQKAFAFHVTLNENGKTAIVEYDFEDESYEQTIELSQPFENKLGTFNLVPTGVFDEYVNADDPISLEYTLIYQSNEQLTTNYLMQLIVGEAREKASILRLTLRDESGQRGVDVLNALLNVYIQNNIEKKNQLASNSLKFIDNQLSLITTDLSSLESEIKAFKTEHGVSDVSAEANFFLTQVGTLDQTISELDVKLSIINYLEEYVANDRDLKNASPSSLGIEDPLLQQLIVTLSQLASERESMLRFTKQDNPLITSIDAKIEDAKQSLTNNMASIRNGLEASKREVKDQLDLVEKKVKTLPKAEYELLALQRQYTIKESLYLLLLEKKSENSIMLASTVSDNMIIDRARASEEPVKPKKSKIYLMGLAVGLAIPSLYILLILFFDNRIKGTDDLNKATNIPFLGIIPHYDSSDYLVVQDKSNSAIGEAFRSVRTNLSFVIRRETLPEGVSPKVVQLTSAVGSEGKSFSSINLGASLGLGGAKTIVVGLDLRKPRLADYFAIPNDVGSSSVLAGINTLDEAIRGTESPGLDVLVGGPIPPNPSELLMSQSLPNMLKELTDRYDYVVLDTPPIGLVTDSLIISEHAATTIYVVRQNVTNASSLGYVNDLYNGGKIKSLSILFNDVKMSRLGSNYGYGYGYGYGGGYYSEPEDSGSLLNKVRRFFGRY